MSNSLLFSLNKTKDKYVPIPLLTTAENVLTSLESDKTLADDLTEIKGKIQTIENSTGNLPDLNTLVKKGDFSHVQILDANNAKSPNVNYVAMRANVPDENSYYYLSVIGSTKDKFIQIARDTDTGMVYTRVYSGNAYSEWVQLSYNLDECMHLNNADDAIKTAPNYCMTASTQNGVGYDALLVVRKTHDFGLIQIAYPFYGNKDTDLIQYRVKLSSGFKPWKALPSIDYLKKNFVSTDYDKTMLTLVDDLNKAIKPNVMYYANPKTPNNPFYTIMGNETLDCYVKLEAWFPLGGYFRQIAYSPHTTRSFIRIYRKDANTNGFTNGWSNWTVNDTMNSDVINILHPWQHSMSKEDLNNPRYPHNYEHSTNKGMEMGLPSTWVFIKYFAHQDFNGFSTQLAYRLNHEDYHGHLHTGIGHDWRVLIRSSHNGTWDKWRYLDDAASQWAGDMPTGHTLAANTLDANNSLELAGSRCYYIATKNMHAGLNLPPYDLLGLDNNANDANIWNYWHRRDMRWGVQFAHNWNGGGLWCRDVWQNTFRDWQQIVTTGRKTAGKIFIDALTEVSTGGFQPPVVSLAIGDNDTGLNRSVNGIFGVVNNGQDTVKFAQNAVSIYPIASKDYGTPSVRNIIISPNDPSGGNDGDIWFKYI